MKAGADMKIAGKTLCVFVLLTITKVMRTVGNKRLTAMVGNNFELTCSPKSNITMLTWKIRPEVGGPCTLGYRADHNKTHKTNCTDSMNWKFRPNQHPALEIRDVGTAHEGNYTCEIVTTEGNFEDMYYLTVLAPPTLTLYCDVHGNPVCKAAAGKPAAQLLWVPNGNFTLSEEGHDNGTVTVVSELTADSANRTNTTCVVSHPAGKQSKSIACHPSNIIIYLTASIILCFLSIIIITIVYRFKFHRGLVLLAKNFYREPEDYQCYPAPSTEETADCIKEQVPWVKQDSNSFRICYGEKKQFQGKTTEIILCHKTKPPETAPTHSSQDDSMEVEPYTTYVQKENVIYNSVSDLTAGHSFPQCHQEHE